MAPMIPVEFSSLSSRSVPLLAKSATSLSKRWVYYGGGLSQDAVIGISVASAALFIIIIICIAARSRGGYYNNGWGGRYYQRGAYVQQAQWPGHGPGQAPPPAYNADTNLYDMHRGPGTYVPPPMYGGPGTFYDPDTGRHGAGTSRAPSAPAPSSRLEEHPGLRGTGASAPSTAHSQPTEVGSIAQPQNDRPAQY